MSAQSIALSLILIGAGGVAALFADEPEHHPSPSTHDTHLVAEAPVQVAQPKPQEERRHVISPDGTHGTVPKSQLVAALKEGGFKRDFAEMTPEEKKEYAEEQHQEEEHKKQVAKQQAELERIRQEAYAAPVYVPDPEPAKVEVHVVNDTPPPSLYEIMRDRQVVSSPTPPVAQPINAGVTRTSCYAYGNSVHCMTF